jgi:predicted membrane-bound spermidine synthase
MSPVVVRAVALLLTLLTGFSGLVYEVTWQKYFATLLGSHSEATAAVLGIFLGGLSVGYGLFGVVTRRVMSSIAVEAGRTRLLGVYGAVEASIGLYALLFPLLFRAAGAASVRLPHLPGGLGFAADVVLAALLIGPPTVLMGGTIPVLTQALSSGLRDATRLHALVYASNTVGAFAGALSAGFLLIPRLGLDAVMLAMGGVNLVAGAIFVLLAVRGRRAAQAPPPPGRRSRRAEAPEPVPAQAVAGLSLLSAVALLSGFAMMAIQTSLNRIAALSIGPSHFTFSVVVATFVLCIAIGSLVVSALRRIPTGAAAATQWALVALLLLLYLEVSNAPYWAHVVRTWFGTGPEEFLPYQLTLAALILAVLAIPIGLSGALLPLLFHVLRREVGDLGAIAGRLYSANTVGSLIGSLVGGYFLLFWLDLHHVARIALAALALAAFLLSVRLLSQRWALASGVALALTIAILLAIPPWNPANLSSGAFRQRVASDATRAGSAAFFAQRASLGKLIFYDDDPNLTAAVREATDGSRALATNGKPDTQIPTELTTVLMLGVLPCLFAEQCESAFVVGLGTGATAGTLGRLDGMRRVVVAEISQGVEAALPLFSELNGEADRNPRIEIRHGDAYRTLLRDPSRYDVIVSEPSNPWVSGVENLYSREFLASAKDRLAPGGVYAQWFHTYESSPEALALVLRTYASVFESVAVWRGLGPDLIVLGWSGSRQPDVTRLETRMRQPGYAAELARVARDAPLALLSHEVLPLGVVHAALGQGETLSLLHPRLSYRAGIDFFVGAAAQLPSTVHLDVARVAVRNSLLRRYLAHRGDQLTDEERLDLIMPTCQLSLQQCATLMGWWAAEAPQSRALQDTARYFIVEQKTLSEALIDQMEQFFRPGWRADRTRTVPLAEAIELVAHFEVSFLPGVPFRRSALRTVIERCRDEADGLLCADLARRTEQVLGDLSIDVSADDGAAARAEPTAALRRAGSPP